MLCLMVFAPGLGAMVLVLAYSVPDFVFCFFWFFCFFFAHFVGDFPVTAVPTHQAAELKKAVLCLAEKIRAFIQT